MTTPPDDTTENLRERIAWLRDRWYQRPGLSEQADALDAALDEFAKDAGDPGDLPTRMAEAIDFATCKHIARGDESACGECRATAALSVRSEHEAQLAGRWGDATRRAELAEMRVERLKEALRDAYAERDQQFERKVAALRERDEAKQQMAEARSTIAAHERHINDTFETNRRVLQKARDLRDEAQDERDVLKAEVERLRAELSEVLSQRDHALNAHMETIRERDYLSHETNRARVELSTTEAERDALKATIGQVRADAIEQRRATGVTKDPWKLGVYAQACRTLGIFNAAMDAPETTPDAPAVST